MYTYNVIFRNKKHHLLLSLTAVCLLQESRFLLTFVECYCSIAMATCNLYCDMALQCSIGDVQIAVCTLHYALLHRITGDLQFALCKLHVSILHCSTDGFQFVLLKLYFATFLCRIVTFFVKKNMDKFTFSFS
jgi:hypothetical protein